jgi:hypothetical protein
MAEERPLAALEQARRLAKWADALSERAAGKARERGSGWTEIGQAAGTTAQAAQQRCASPSRDHTRPARCIHSPCPPVHFEKEKVMGDEDSLLNHLAWRFNQPKEILATEALGYVLIGSDACRRALADLAADCGVRVQANLTYKTQDLEAGAGSPDAVGVLPNGRPQVILEGKFQAAFTPHQPGSYLKRLEPDHPGILFFVVPAATMDWRWREILERCGEDSVSNEERAVDDELRVMGLRTGHHVAIVSWNHVITQLLKAAEKGGDRQAVASLGQLNALCATQDRQTFNVITSDDLNLAIPRRMIDYHGLIKDIKQAAIDSGAVPASNLGRGGSGTGWGHYVPIGKDRWEALLEFSPELWRDHGYGPFWLSFTNNWTPEGATEYKCHAAWQQIRESLAPLSSDTPVTGAKVRPIPVRTRNGQPILALPMPMGTTRQQVIDSIVDQLREISALLDGATATVGADIQYQEG